MIQKMQNQEYEIEQILAAKFSKLANRYYYLVKWLNWDVRDSTWEPEENLINAGDIMEDFKTRLSRNQANFQWQAVDNLREFWKYQDENCKPVIKGKVGRPKGKHKKIEKPKNPQKQQAYKLRNKNKTEQPQRMPRNHIILYSQPQEQQNQQQQIYDQQSQSKFQSSIQPFSSKMEPNSSQQWRQRAEIFASMSVSESKFQENIFDGLTQKEQSNVRSQSQQIISNLQARISRADAEPYIAIGIRRIGKEKGEIKLEYLVENKQTRKKQWITQNQVLQHCPISLIKYYESKMLFPKDKSLPQTKQKRQQHSLYHNQSIK